ncbi:MAG: DNA/RNA non-specific endonuclease [Gemmataceae bacterium]|nr:DNA/RNA non-specific endonuclease [Gemmataceae bacterium]
MSTSPLARRALALAAVLIGLWAAAVGCRPRVEFAPADLPQTLANRNVRFGLPAEAKHDPASRDAFLIDRPQYVLSYNDSRKIPNWVCWHLSAADIGKADRSAFADDPGLPDGFRHVTTGMYTGSGFDRGHMCPSKDRSDSKENNEPLFYMTNIVPQAPKCNQGAWARFEDHCRKLVRDGNELYIACGPHGAGGTGTEGEKEAIGRAVKVTVPAAVWKVVLVLPGADAKPTRDSKTLAVWMPNDQTVGKDWEAYAVTVGEVEKKTGFTFFPLVPADVARAIKEAH